MGHLGLLDDGGRPRVLPVTYAIHEQALWTAIDLFLGLVLGPIMGTMSIPSRIELSSRLMPKLLLLMPTLVTMTLGSGFQLARKLGYLQSAYPDHPWLVASFIVVGVMAVIALGLLEPANIAVLFELRKPEPNGPRIAKLTCSRFAISTCAWCSRRPPSSWPATCRSSAT